MNWEELSQLPWEGILAWAEEQPWARAVAICQQDADWHAEGDVWTHTKMVCRELTQLEEWPVLTEQDRQLLLFTALFHDSAKPLTTRYDAVTGRLTSPKHAVKGEHLARNILRELDCPLLFREEIASLVRYHGRPAFLLERPDPSHEVARLSWLVQNRLLYLLALADTRGRSTSCTSRPEENLHLWKMAAEEIDCFYKPYPFASDHARFVFFRQQEPNLYYVPHEEYSCTVVLLVGLPGVGKDTWLSRNDPGLTVVSLDAIRAELGVDATDNQGPVIQRARERCRELLRAHTPFAFNATNTVRQTRQRWIDLFADYGARIEIVYLEPPLAEILRRNAKRDRPVPEHVIRELAEKIDVPTLEEAHQVELEES